MNFKNLVNRYFKEPPLDVKLPGDAITEEGRLDIYSETWVFVRNWAQKELASARERNDYFKNDEIKTAALRGRIKLLKEILSLPKTNTD